MGEVAGSWLVPGHEGELVTEVGDLRLPDPAVVARAVNQDQGVPFTNPLDGDLKSVLVRQTPLANSRVERACRVARLRT